MAFPTSTLDVSRGYTYTYIHITPSTNKPKPYILFLHGFPSSPLHYRAQIKDFSQKGHGIIAPALLGYEGTSKPLDRSAYTGKGMSEDVLEILKKEGVEKCIGVAHDWGSFLLSRVHNYAPGLFTHVAFLDIGYLSPGHGLNLNAVNFINQTVQEKLGYSVFGYFKFFDEEGAGELMEKHIQSFESLFHSKDENIKKKYMGAEGGTRKWCEGDMIAPYPAYYTKEDQEQFRQEFAPEKGGFHAAINWYRGQLHDVNAADEAEIPKAAHILTMPALLIKTTNYTAKNSDFAAQMKPYVTDFTVKQVQADHWVMMEKPEEVNEILEEFIGK